MFTPLILFLGLTVATAVIAHWSDNLGKKLGKKRVSLFGLRPRTTATVLTVASSWAIMLFTLVVLLAAVAPLRTALFSYDRKTGEYRRDIAQADAQIKATRKSLSATQTQFNTTKTQLDNAKSDLEKANSAVETAQDAANQAEYLGKQRAQVANQAASRAVLAARAAQNQVVVAQNRVVAAQNRLASAQKRLLTAQKSETAARRGETAAQGETRLAEAETRRAEQATREAQQLKKSADSNLKRSLGQVKVAQNQLKSTKAQLGSASRQLYTAGRLLYKNGREVIALNRTLSVRRQEALAFAASDAPIKVGQTFAAGVVDANQSPLALVSQLRVLLRQGRVSLAESEDAALTRNFPEDVSLQLLPLTGQDASGKPVDLQGERLLQRLASDIRAQNSANLVAVRLVAPRNYLAGEKRIEAIFAFVPVVPAFAAGEILASTLIDGAQGEALGEAQGEALIFNSLLELTQFGRTEAEKRGVNPPQLGNEPLFYAKDTNVEIFKAKGIIERSKKRLRVNLVAARALSTVEPLQVRFEIEGALDAPTS